MSGSSPAIAPHAIPTASAHTGVCIQPAAFAAPNPAAVNKAPPATCVWLVTPCSCPPLPHRPAAIHSRRRCWRSWRTDRGGCSVPGPTPVRPRPAVTAGRTGIRAEQAEDRAACLKAPPLLRPGRAAGARPRQDPQREAESFSNARKQQGRFGIPQLTAIATRDVVPRVRLHCPPESGLAQRTHVSRSIQKRLRRYAPVRMAAQNLGSIPEQRRPVDQVQSDPRAAGR